MEGRGEEIGTARWLGDSLRLDDASMTLLYDLMGFFQA